MNWRAIRIVEQPLSEIACHARVFQPLLVLDANRRASEIVREPDGGLGTICIYEASSPAKIREHASLADIPADDIVEIVDTMIVRADPVLAAA